jgi:hypothetical protein
MRSLPLLLLLSGCCISDGTFENVRSAVSTHGHELEELRTMLAEVCSSAEAPSECDELVRRFNALQASYTEINEGTR